MKVVIAGGTGLLGRALGAALASDSWEVVALTRRPGSVASVADGLRLVEWDGRSTAGGWAAELAGADAVVDLCGASVGMWPWTAATRRTLRTSRLEPRLAIIEALEALESGSRPAVFLAASGTDGYVGADQTPATEDTPSAATFLGRLCRDWEAEAARAEPLGVRVVHSRMSAVIARGAPVVDRLALPVRLGIGGRIGFGEQWFSWVHIDDAVGAMRLLLADGSISGPVNIASPGALQQIEVARTLGKILHRPSFVWTPAPLLQLVLGGQADLVLGSRRVSPARIQAAGFTFAWANFEAAARDALR
jgi:uncharacterized protein (TIGR01777 family)